VYTSLPTVFIHVQAQHNMWYVVAIVSLLYIVAELEDVPDSSDSDL